ncbi:MAG TPA: carbohydrate kinase family protein [Gaiellaceae bacterium]|nr:carbohydrate kinase family protein [Gaiellaceae bacterium]
MGEVVCLGILVADVLARPVDDVPWGSLGLVDEVVLRGGGCALNTASALVKLGVPARVVGKVGADPFGDFVLGLLDERGVGREGVVRELSVPTSASVALVSTAGERTFLHTYGANAHVRADEVDLTGASCLHIAGALVLEALDGEPMATLLAAARSRGILTSLDTVYDASGRWSRVEPSLPHLDVASPSIAEARAISGLAEPAAVAAWFRARGVGTIALKMGAEGCYVSGEGFEGPVAAPKVEAVDGTGAGDAFDAGLLAGILAGRPLEESARVGCAAGALAATAVGAFEGVGDAAETLALAGLEGSQPRERLTT